MEKCSYCIVGALRRRCFPIGGNNRADNIRPYERNEITWEIFGGRSFDFYAIIVYELASVHAMWLNGFVRRLLLDIYSEYQDFYRINIHLAFELIHRIHEYTQRF